MSKEYDEYLSSQEWKEKRELVFKNRWRACQKCNSTSNLHIHHGTYVRVYKERLSDLYVLCKSCHDLFHSKYGVRNLYHSTRRFILWSINEVKVLKKTPEQRRIDKEEKIKKAMQYILCWMKHNKKICTQRIWDRALKRVHKEYPDYSWVGVYMNYLKKK